MHYQDKWRDDGLSKFFARAALDRHSRDGTKCVANTKYRGTDLVCCLRRSKQW